MMTATEYATLKAPYAAAAQTSPSNISIYTSYANARSAALSARKPQAVVLGDESHYVVCGFGPAARLVAAGYQYA